MSVVSYRQGHVQRRDVLEDVEHPPARSRLSISSTSKLSIKASFIRLSSLVENPTVGLAPHTP